MSWKEKAEQHSHAHGQFPSYSTQTQPQQYITNAPYRSLNTHQNFRYQDQSRGQHQGQPTQQQRYSSGGNVMSGTRGTHGMPNQYGPRMNTRMQPQVGRGGSHQMSQQQQQQHSHTNVGSGNIGTGSQTSGTGSNVAATVGVGVGVGVGSGSGVGGPAAVASNATVVGTGANTASGTGAVTVTTGTSTLSPGTGTITNVSNTQSIQTQSNAGTQTVSNNNINNINKGATTQSENVNVNVSLGTQPTQSNVSNASVGVGPASTESQGQVQVQAQVQTQTQTQEQGVGGDDSNSKNMEQPKLKTQPQVHPVPQQKKKPMIGASPSQIRAFGTKYEVKCDETFAYYDGYVVDFDTKERKFEVMYDDDWKQKQWVPVDYIRKCADEAPKNWSPKKQDRVECKAKAEAGEPFGWWTCFILDRKDDVYVINYEGWEHHHDVMELAVLRPLNPHNGFKDSKLKPIEKKEEPCDRYNWITDNLDQLKLIQERTGLIHLGFRPDTKHLIFIGTKQQVNNAFRLYCYLLEIQQKYSVNEEKEQAKEKELSDDYQKYKNCHKVEFSFDPELTRFLIGRKGSNIDKAKMIEGVEHINVDPENSTCLILAQTYEAANHARSILEMEKATVEIPRSAYRGIIGDGGQNVKNLEEKSGVVLISTLTHYQRKIAKDDFVEESKPDKTTMVIIGSKESVEVARELIAEDVNYLNSMRDINIRQREAHQSLREIGDDYSVTRSHRRQNRSNYNNSYNANSGYTTYETYDKRNDKNINEDDTIETRKNENENENEDNDENDNIDINDDNQGGNYNDYDENEEYYDEQNGGIPNGATQNKGNKATKTKKYRKVSKPDTK